jgi:nucleoside-diphosphate kinase
MNQERTLIIIKPDALSKKVGGRIISAFEENNLRLVGAKFIHLGREQVEQFYAEHRGKEFYEPLVQFMTSNPCLAMAWEGPDAIKRAREVIGATDPAQAKEGTVRRNYATDNRHNAVHGSDSVKSAEREIAFFFTAAEIFDWEDKIYKK